MAAGCTGRSHVVAQETPEAANEQARVKPVIDLTDAAVAALVHFLGPGELRREHHPLRVAVEGTADTVYSYFFGFADDPKEPHYKVDPARDVIHVVKGFPIAVRREAASTQ